MAEKIISQKVVSQTVVGSTNPILKRFGNLKDAVVGACISPIVILIAIGVLFYSEGFQRSSELLADLTLEQATEVSDESGAHKIQGVPTISNELEAPEVGQVLYYSSKIEIYEQVEETERETITKVIDGQEVEEVVETVKLVDKWQTESKTDGQWADFNLAGIEIATGGAKLEMNYKTAEYWDEGYGDFYEIENGTSITPKIGDRRIIVTYLETDEELIVAGELSDGKMANTGEIFVISNKSDAVLISDLESTESTMYLAMKFMAWLLLTIGLGSILAPVIAVVDFIPFAGGIAKTIGFFTSAITALIIVVIASVLIKFWWLFLILLLLLVGGLVALLVTQGGKEKK